MRVSKPGRSLPPLNAVKAFDAAARLGGFKAAASEMGVSAPAISHQVKLLEAHLGITLFHRQSNGVSLTIAGEVVFRNAREALDGLAELPRHVVGDDRPRVVISIMNSLAQAWLYRYLDGLRRQVPEVGFEIREEGDPVSFGRDAIDIRIAYGDHLYPGYTVRQLLTDQVTPLCTPEFLARTGLDPKEPQRLPDAALIHSHWGHSFTSYPTWADWFSRAGCPRQAAPGVHGHSVMFPASAIQMALAGVGVCLGQRFLAASELASGRLVAPFGVDVAMPHPYALVTRGASPPESVTRVAGWLFHALREQR